MSGRGTWVIALETPRTSYCLLQRLGDVGYCCKRRGKLPTLHSSDKHGLQCQTRDYCEAMVKRVTMAKLGATAKRGKMARRR